MSSSTLRRPRTLTATLAGLSAAALLLAGCSDSDDSSSDSSTSASSSTGDAVADVTNAANDFLDTLDDDQKSEVLLDFNNDNAAAWSNLPCGSSCRVGIEFNDLSEEQLTAAKAVVQAATGTSTGTGYDQAMQILAADDVLGDAQADGTGGGPGSGQDDGGTPPSGGPGDDMGGDMGGGPGGDMGGDMSGAPGAPDADSSDAASTDDTDAATTDAADSADSSDAAGGPDAGGDGGQGGGGGGGYSSGNYYLAFLGEPSEDGTWQLHFGGHHLAVNVTYADGEVAGASPFFIGVEPKEWTADDGTEYAPLDIMKNGMYDMINSLDEDQLATAKLDDSFTDVLLGPDEDGNFPETKEGIKVSELSEDQQAKVLAAMKPWVQIADDQTAESLLDIYKDELDETYVSYSGETDLTAQGDYIRIDGPSVWVEFVCQNGVVYSDQIHYHTVYRDHTRDYGGQLSF